MKRKGVNAIKLVDNDTLIKVLFANEENIALLTHNGMFKIIDTTSINPIGRVAQGVICAKLDANDYIVDANIVAPSCTEVISVSAVFNNLFNNNVRALTPIPATFSFPGSVDKAE